MSIILKGIDLPDKGEVICLEIYSDGSVWDKSNWEPHPPKVSAMQIPKEHGRLIDEKEILSPVMCRPKSLRLDNNAQYNMITLIVEAPTILESEEE